MRLWLERLLQDVRYAMRGLARNPGFTLVVVVSLGLGIGANSALFSVMDAVLLRPLPVTHPEQLFALDLTESRFRSPQRFSYPMFEQMRAVAPSGIAAMSRIARTHGRIDATSGGTSELETIPVQLVSGEYFRMLGIAPALGRVFGPGDNERIGEHPVAVISHDFWQRRFGSARDVLGRGVTLNGAHFTIVGVASPGFRGLWLESSTDIWIPLMMQSAVHYAQNFSDNDADPEKPWLNQEGIRWLDIVVRSRHDVAAIDTVFRQGLAASAEKISNPDDRRLFLQQRIILDPVERGFSNLRGRFSGPLFALAGMVGLVLLIACFNTASLMLARASARGREIAVRLSVGAGRARLIRQLLTESFLLAGIAAIVGLGLAHLASQLLVRATLGISEGPAPFTTGVNARVLGFTVGISILTAVLFGLFPAVRATRVDLEAALRAGSRGLFGGARFNSQKFLVAAQIALTFVLVVAAAWFTASLRYLARLNLGYDQDHVVTALINPQSAGYPEAQLPALHRRLVESVEALPGVDSAAVAMCGLASGCRSTSDIDITGYQPAPGEKVQVQENIAGLNYFSTVGMRLLAGRDFTERDTAKSAAVAIINESAERRYFSNRNALGQRFGYGKPNFEIVGIVADARVNSARETAPPMAFYPLAQRTVYGGALEVRVAGDPATRLREVSEAIMNVDRNLPIDSIHTVRTQVDGNFRQDRVITWLAAIFGALALSLACFGIYGAMSYAVTRRTGEMGIRMALGASPSRVFAMVLLESLALLAIGLVAGAPLLFGAARLIASVVLGVDLRDPLIVCGSALVVALAAALAAYLPARRASSLDPVAALRSE